MAKKIAKKTPKQPRKPRLRSFTVYFYLEGGITIWMRERAETRAALEQRTQRLIKGPGVWMRLDAYSGSTHLRREKVVGFLVEDHKADLDPEPMTEEDKLLLDRVMRRFDKEEIFLDKKS